MIVEEIKNIKSEKRDLRNFGITMSVVFGLIGIVLGTIGAVFSWHCKDFYIHFLILSGAFLFPGLVAPILLFPIQKVWMTLSILMGWVMTRVILSVLFYLTVTPIGLAARLFGKDFLELRFGKNSANSYWIPRGTTEVVEDIAFEKGKYENQY